jgi:hypothetical protein
MKVTTLCLLLCLPLSVSAAVTVNFYSGLNNLPQTVLADQIDLANATDLSEGYARINNGAHVESGGESMIGFMRFRYGDDVCGYFYRSSNRDNEDPAFSDFESIETWGYVYWQGDGSLVDGAQWGSDNYILMRNELQTVVGVLQFHFDESTLTASLIASAIDLEGLTFTQGINAIEAAAIPEPAAFAMLAGAVGFGIVVLRRRRRA